jgi:hypothetical protein
MSLKNNFAFLWYESASGPGSLFSGLFLHCGKLFPVVLPKCDKIVRIGPLMEQTPPISVSGELAVFCVWFYISGHWNMYCIEGPGTVLGFEEERVHGLLVQGTTRRTVASMNGRETAGRNFHVIYVATLCAVRRKVYHVEASGAGVHRELGIREGSPSGSPNHPGHVSLFPFDLLLKDLGKYLFISKQSPGDGGALQVGFPGC